MIKRFYKWVEDEDGKRIRVLDFDKVRADGNQINIIISERFRQGKTVSSMQHILERYIEKGEGAALILNTQDLFDTVRDKLIIKNRIIYKEMWEPVKLTRKGLYYKDEMFCMFVPLTGWGKIKPGGRPDNITTIVYDEINVSDRTVRNSQLEWLLSIVYSLSPKGKSVLFAFCNNLTIDLPLLTRLGFTEFSENEVQYRKFGVLRAMFYVPKTSAEQKRIIAKEGNWNNDFARLLGMEGMAVFNENNYDNNSGVVPHSEHHTFRENTSNDFFYFHPHCYAKVWRGGAYKQWFLEYYNHRPKDAANVWALNKKKTDHNIKYDDEVRWNYLSEFKMGRVLFSDFALKSAFLKDVL